METMTMTDTKYCYISTITSQSSSPSNYQNIPYRMPTTTPVIYQGSDVDPLYYMPIAIWSNVPVFTNTVYYNNGTNTVTYPLDTSGILDMNWNSGPVMYGNGAGSSDTVLGSKATPFFGKYQEHDGPKRNNWQVYTGYACGYDASTCIPPAAPVKISAAYTSDIHIGDIYNGYITVTLYNYAEYRAQAYIQLLAGSSTKYESNVLTADAMTVSSSKLDPGTCTFSIKLSNDSEVRSITSIKVYWYSQSDWLTSYAYPVSFTIGGGSESCTCTALNMASITCVCTTRTTKMDACICAGNAANLVIICSCSGEHSQVAVCSSGNAHTSCSSSSTQITVSPV